MELDGKYSMEIVGNIYALAIPIVESNRRTHVDIIECVYRMYPKSNLWKRKVHKFQQVRYKCFPMEVVESGVVLDGIVYVE